ncbi:MAG: porin [Fimbriimonas sp.]
MEKMGRIRRWNELAAFAVICALPVIATAQTADPKAAPANTTAVVKAALDKVSKDEAIAVLEAKRKEARELTKKAGEVALSLTSAKEQDMSELREQLKSILERLTKIDEELDAVKGWIEGQNEALPIITYDVLDLKRNTWGNYLQFQYVDTNRQGGRTDSFQVRRARLGVTQRIDPRTAVRFSFDLGGTPFTGVNLPAETTTQMRDAFLTYDIEPSDVKVGTALTAGQFSVPVGYEVERSSAEREFPERAQYNLVNFAGERTRGAFVRHGLSTSAVATVGVLSPLSVNDGEQRAFTGSRGNKLATVVGLKTYSTKYDLGISLLQGERAGYKVGWSGNADVVAPDVTRRFIYVDGSYIGLIVPKLFVRGEAMFGKDRTGLSLAESTVTSGAAAGIQANDARLGERDMRGYHVILGYNLSTRNQLNFKYEQYDPNIDANGDLFEGYGLAYRYFINPGAVVTLAHEIFEDQTRAANGLNPGNKRYHVTTLRMQFRF